MRILVTNDDGILEPGLRALQAAAAELGEVTVVAPDSPQSAVGHSITVLDPILTRRVHVEGRFWGTAIRGRPADCVKLAWRQIMAEPPELVLSGINAGSNVGINVLYSGTVAAAAEGAILGAPSVAFSLEMGGEIDFQRAARHCRAVLDGLLAGGLAPGELVNVNIPDLSAGRPKGVKVVRQSIAGIDDTYQRRTDPRGRDYYWLEEAYDFRDPPADSDVIALRSGYITVTPLQVDLTASNRLAHLAGLDLQAGGAP